MSAPEPRSPLAALRPSLAGVAGAGLVLAERRCRLTEIVARRGCAASVAADLPGDALALAPGRWLVVSREAAPFPEPSDVVDRASLVDVSGAHAVLHLSGPAVAALMPVLCRLDLTTLKPGDVARTPMAQVPVILRVVDAGSTYDLIVPATFARHFVEALIHTAASHGGITLEGPTP